MVHHISPATIEGAADHTDLTELLLSDANMSRHSSPQLGRHHAFFGSEVYLYALRLRIHL